MSKKIKLSKHQEEVYRKIIRELNENREKIYEMVPNEGKRKLFDAVYMRAKDPTDPLVAQNRGRYYELFFKIIIGEIKTVQDVFLENVKENIPHTEKGDGVSERGVHFQIKGPGASLNIYNPEEDLVFNGETLDQSKSITNVIDTYHKLGNRGQIWRYGIGIGTQYYGAMLDIGQQTMMRYVKKQGPQAFTIKEDKGFTANLTLDYLRKKGIDDVDETIKFLQGALKDVDGKGDFAILKDLAKSRGYSRPFDKDLIKKAISQLKKQRYLISFKGGESFATDMLVDYGAVLRTTIQRDENHTPFYRLLFSLGIRRTSYYPRYSGNYMRRSGFHASTFGNKLPEYYYENKYHNIRY